MEYIDRVYYINLDHRTDRNEQFLQEMDKLGLPNEKMERISAVYTKDFGILGCGLSHLKTLQEFLKSPYQNCIVFEDDFMLNTDVHYAHFLLRTLFEEKRPFDLVMLAGNIIKHEATNSLFLEKVLDGQTTSAYLITREFAPKLIQSLEESTRLLAEWYATHNEKKHEYCLDIYWKTLQPSANWFVFHPKIGIQRESYSDIEYKVTNYKV